MLKFSKKNQAGYFSKSNKKSIKRSIADYWFSIFIRLRDIVKDDWCFCITCNKKINWKYEADCGHFATRDKSMTRFNEKNCHAQCKRCNNFKKGEQAKHGFAIDKLYGQGTAQSLIDLSEVRGQKVHTKMALDDISKEYRTKAKLMAEKKGIKI